jgi:hypothetical protein
LIKGVCEDFSYENYRESLMFVNSKCWNF